jgi:hypothetical protein
MTQSNCGPLPGQAAMCLFDWSEPSRQDPGLQGRPLPLSQSSRGKLPGETGEALRNWRKLARPSETGEALLCLAAARAAPLLGLQHPLAPPSFPALPPLHLLLGSGPFKLGWPSGRTGSSKGCLPGPPCQLPACPAQWVMLSSQSAGGDTDGLRPSTTR